MDELDHPRMQLRSKKLLWFLGRVPTIVGAMVETCIGVSSHVGAMASDVSLTALDRMRQNPRLTHFD